MGTGGIRLDGGDGVSSHLQIIAELEALVEMQARTVRVLATRLAELGDTVTGRDEIADDGIGIPQGHRRGRMAGVKAGGQENVHRRGHHH